jgi:hypothetical protein
MCEEKKQTTSRKRVKVKTRRKRERERFKKGAKRCHLR